MCLKFLAYIFLAGESRALYVGVTSNLKRHVWEHKNEIVEGFTKKYHIHTLVYYECGENMLCAISREKQVKKWSRAKKIRLIEGMNPEWKDLYEEIV